MRLCSALILIWNTSWAAIPPHMSRGTVPSPPQSILGVNTHFASRSHNRNAIVSQSRLVASSMTGWVREDFHWYRIQRTPDAYDWSFTDTTVTALRSEGIQILGVLGHPPGWATPDRNDDPYDNSFAAPNPQQFAAWAAHTVSRYRGQIQYWQIWNEPDNPHFWFPAPDPRAYANLVHVTAAAIARVAPEVQLVAAGVNPFSPEFLSAAAAAGLWNDVDIIAIHPYVNPTDPRDASLDDAVQFLAPLLERYGPKPIWVTELGWGSGHSDRDPPFVMTPALQATYLVAAMPILWQSGVSHIFWYSWKDEQRNPYGLYAWGDGPDDMTNPKPAAVAFQAMQTQQRLLPAPSRGHLVLGFEGPNNIWVRGDEHHGVLFPSQNRATDGTTSAALRYAFPYRGNQYLVFRRWHHAPLPLGTQRICLNVWGDNTSTQIKVWLRGSDKKRVQLVLGLSGPSGWRTVCSPIPARFASWDQIDPSDGILHQPATFEALVFDDIPDGSGAAGIIYLDELRAFFD